MEVTKNLIMHMRSVSDDQSEEENDGEGGFEDSEELGFGDL
jgi:hypothetical protein